MPDCRCYSCNHCNRGAAVPSWITLAGRSLTIGSTIYTVNMTNFLICFQYAKALPFERWTICYCVHVFFFFIPSKVKSSIYLNSISHKSSGIAITVKNWLWYGSKLHSMPRGSWIHPWGESCCSGHWDCRQGWSRGQEVCWQLIVCTRVRQKKMKKSSMDSISYRIKSRADSGHSNSNNVHSHQIQIVCKHIYSFFKQMIDKIIYLNYSSYNQKRQIIILECVCKRDFKCCEHMA